jgi:hypothetical protein
MIGLKEAAMTRAETARTARSDARPQTAARGQLGDEVVMTGGVDVQAKCGFARAKTCGELRNREHSISNSRLQKVQ